MDNKIKIEDESGDRKYFTIIPNYILNHSTATAQALYLQLKRLAGDNGLAYPSSRYLRERLKISQPTLRKELKYLLDKNWIKYSGEREINTSGGIQKIKCYKIVDLWQLNNEFYQRGEKIETPYNQRGEKIDTQGVKKSAQRGEKIGNKEELSNNIHIEEEHLQAKPAINEIFDLFYNSINPNINYSNKTQRSAVDWLINKYGQEKVKAMIEYAISVQGNKYAPVITTPYQLKEKLAQLVIFKQNNKSKCVDIDAEIAKQNYEQSTIIQSN